MACPVEEMVETAQTRNCICMLQPLLEDLIETGSTEPCVHNALGKIRILLNCDPNSLYCDPNSFLLKNIFHDPNVLGPFCESHAPSLDFFSVHDRIGSFR
jgi:clathrin heavy chain